jgi:hypothetical protein
MLLERFSMLFCMGALLRVASSNSMAVALCPAGLDIIAISIAEPCGDSEATLTSICTHAYGQAGASSLLLLLLCSQDKMHLMHAPKYETWM